MRLHQGERPIEEYVLDFIELSHSISLDEVCLMILFMEGYLSRMYAIVASGLVFRGVY